MVPLPALPCLLKILLKVVIPNMLLQKMDVNNILNAMIFDSLIFKPQLIYLIIICISNSIFNISKILWDKKKI